MSVGIAQTSCNLIRLSLGVLFFFNPENFLIHHVKNLYYNILHHSNQNILFKRKNQIGVSV